MPLERPPAREATPTPTPPAPSEVRASPPVERPRAPEPTRTLRESEAPARQVANTPKTELRRNRADLRVGIATGAKVVSTPVFRSPDRFVVDLVVQRGAPLLPSATGPIEPIRVRQPPDRTRLADAKRDASGRANRRRLSSDVVLDFAR